MVNVSDIIQFCNQTDYDIRKTGNARWIDQKCTPDVIWSISDFILNYVDNIKEEFTVSDIWKSDYAKITISETYSKPGTDEATAENEYDKVFSQPINLLCYAGILEDISPNSRHLYKIKNREILEYIARNDMFSLRFLQIYIEKVLKDSGIYPMFQIFFDSQDKITFIQLKNEFINFYHRYTPIQKDYEPKRIFTKVLNPLAYKLSKFGTEKGHISKNIIRRCDLMYNRDNFRDVYLEKPKEISRQEWLAMNPNIDLRRGYFVQMLARAKRTLKDFISVYHENVSELTRYGENYNDFENATQIHHIFPKNEFPEIMHYLENLIALTPNQHYGFAHPNNNTQIIDLAAQKVLLIAKTYSIQDNLENPIQEHIYEFQNLLYILHIGWNNNEVLDIEDNNFIDVVHFINYHYDEVNA